MQMETVCFRTKYVTQNNAELVFAMIIILVELYEKWNIFIIHEVEIFYTNW